MAAMQFELFAREARLKCSDTGHTDAPVLNLDGQYFDLIISCDYAQICGASSSLTESTS
jgi:hypothetical protein